MDAVRYDISAYTASFRLPGLMGYQATAPVPPPSTVFGLLSAAAGRDVTPINLEWLAYRFTYDTRATDLEKIIGYTERGSFTQKAGGINTIPIKREFLYAPRLVLYLPPNTFETDLLHPRFPICLGRSQDLAMIDSVRTVRLEPVSKVLLEGVLLPFPSEGNTPSSAILSFPTYMQTTIPRTPAAVHMFHVVTKRQEVSGENLYQEPGEELGVPQLTRKFLMSNGS